MKLIHCATEDRFCDLPSFRHRSSLLASCHMRSISASLAPCLMPNWRLGPCHRHCSSLSLSITLHDSAIRICYMCQRSNILANKTERLRGCQLRRFGHLIVKSLSPLDLYVLLIDSIRWSWSDQRSSGWFHFPHAYDHLPHL